MGRALVPAVVAALALAGSAFAGTTTGTVPGALKGSLAPPAKRLTEAQVTRIFLADDKVADWLGHYPRRIRADRSDLQKARAGRSRSGPARRGEVATGKVDDTSGAVTEAWTGPQVAWKMARGYDGAFGGKEINSAAVWLGFCLLFLVGLADLRRPLSMRNLDLLALLSFSRLALVLQPRRHLHQRPAGLPAAALPARADGLERVARAAGHRRGPGLADLAAGGRDGLHGRFPRRPERARLERDRRRLLGCDRRRTGSRTGSRRTATSRSRTRLKACGKADSEGEIRERIQTNGRCESANPQGDTYGPVAYEAYLPGYLILGWTGKVGRSSGGAPRARSSSTCSACWAWRSSACASAGPGWP